jgi:hypothetical protein
VGQDAPQLLPVEDLQDSGGDGHGGVVPVAPRGEGVGLAVGGDVEAGHGQARGAGQLPDDAVVVGHLRLGHGHGPGGLDDEHVGFPVGEADDQQTQAQADDSAAAAEERPDEHEQATQAG